MKLTIIGKYPPISGGESAKLYWLSKRLGERGHTINIISDCQERKGKSTLKLEDLDFLQPNRQVRLYSTSPLSVDEPEKPFITERLSNLALKVIATEDTDLILGMYLLPYGSSAHISGQISGKPYLIQHAGSDMKRLFQSPNLKAYLMNVLALSSGIMSYPSHFNFFKAFSNNVFLNSPHIDIDSFEQSPDFDLKVNGLENLTNKKIITYLGKLDKQKGVYELLNAYRNTDTSESALLFVGAGKEKEGLEEMVRGNKIRNVFFGGSIPPWRVPGLLRKTAVFVVPERDFFIKSHVPRKPMESLACRTPVILSSEVKNKRAYIGLKDGENCVVVNPKDIREFSIKLRKLIGADGYREIIGERGYEFALQNNSFEDYTERVEGFLESVLRNG